jgi:adenylylsulfate kinase-like enzyme
MVVLITGLPNSGKTTLGKIVSKKLSFKFVDGIEFRRYLKLEKDFSYESSKYLIEKLIEKLNKSQNNTILAMVIPWKDLRLRLKKEVKDFYEIFLQSKRKSRKNYKNVIIPGINMNYEKSNQIDLIIDTDIYQVEESTKIIIEFIKGKMIELNTKEKGERL